ncbi:MAG: hypothetical protein JST89_01165 [Cyanobacteria bacterium SZAS-4]|nr:hypothetical protein [Cyanobacteria bacterium SZAS-4]
MNADRNWERNEPNDRDSRGGPQRGFQFSDAYGPGGGAAGNQVINDIHCKNATFDQQGFPDGAQLLPEEQGGDEGGHEHGRGHGHGHGRVRGGREEEGPRGRFEVERDERGQWEHGGQGRWEKIAHGGRGRGGHRGHHGHGGPSPEELDADGQPIAGSVEANEMGINAPPIDANGNPIYQTMTQPVDYSTQPVTAQPADFASYSAQTQPTDYSPQSYTAQPADYTSYSTQTQPADYSSQTFSAQPVDSSASGADPLVAQLSTTNPDVAKVLTDAQNQMTPQGYAALSQLMQQNLSSGGDGNTALLTSIGQMQQLGGPQLAPDVAALQTVIQTDAPNLLAAVSAPDASATSDATALSSTNSSSYPSTGYSTPTSAAV